MMWMVLECQTYVIPIQLREPFPNATKYFSKDSPSGAFGLLNHLSGTKLSGFGYISGLNCTSWIVIDTGIPGGIIQSPNSTGASMIRGKRHETPYDSRIPSLTHPWRYGSFSNFW